MGAAPKPSDEAARLSALRRYGILDTAAEPAFDRITSLVSRAMGVSISLVSLIDAERQWFKSCVGLGDLTDVDPVLMEQMTDRLRAAVAAITSPLSVTASFGVCHSSTVTTPEAILEAADAALYRAKTGGRNRVVVADTARA